MELGLGGGGLRHRKNSPNWGGELDTLFANDSTNLGSITELISFLSPVPIQVEEEKVIVPRILPRNKTF